jgi:hypothetical protein
MFDYERSHEVKTWLQGVLLGSVFVSPDDPGLTYAEILDLARRRNTAEESSTKHSNPTRPNRKVVVLSRSRSKQPCT